MILQRVTPGIFICIECRHLCQMILASFVLLLSPTLIWLTRLDIVDQVFIAASASVIIIFHLIVFFVKSKFNRRIQ